MANEPYAWTAAALTEHLGFASHRPAPPHIASSIDRAAHACGQVVTLNAIPPERDLSGSVARRLGVIRPEADRLLSLLGVAKPTDCTAATAPTTQPTES